MTDSRNVRSVRCRAVGKQVAGIAHTRCVDGTKTLEALVAPRPEHPQDNYWLRFGAGVAGSRRAGADIYSDVKAACRTAVKKFRDQRWTPGEEGEYMHQLVAEAFIGPARLGKSLYI